MCALCDLGELIVPLPAVWLDLVLGFEFEFDIEMLISGGDPVVADVRGSDLMIPNW